MIKLRDDHRWNRKRKRKRGKGRCDDPCDLDCCDGPPCLDFGLFSTLLLMGASAAELTSRVPGRNRSTASAVRGVAGPAGRVPVSGLRVPAGSGPAWDRFGLSAIRGYRRWLSPHWPGHCRFTPTCSAYGLAAVERHGLAVGGRLAAARLRRCRPEVPCGTLDPLH